LTGGHVLIEDVPGTGKTLTARSLSSALGLPSNRIRPWFDGLVRAANL